MTLKELYKTADYKDSHGMLFHGDCLEIMKNIEDESIDMILCDLAHVSYNTSCGELFKALNTVLYSDGYKSNPNRAERRGKK